MYVIVEFPATNAVSAMPEGWLITDELCYWPLKDQTRCIREQVQKNEKTWRKCSMRLFRHANGLPRKYVSYNVANQKTAELLETSDLSSTESEDVAVQETRTRQKHLAIPPPPKPSFFSVNSLETLNSFEPAPHQQISLNESQASPFQNQSDVVVQETRTKEKHLAIPPPRKPSFVSINPLESLNSFEPTPHQQISLNEPQASPFQNQSDVVQETRTREKHLAIPPPRKPSFFSINPLESLNSFERIPHQQTSLNESQASPFQNQSVYNPPYEYIAPSPEPRNNHDEPVVSGENPTNAELLDAIKNLSAIVVKMDQRIKSVENYIYHRDLQQNDAEAHKENSAVDLPKLPATTVDEILALEQFLDSQRNTTVLISYLCCVGGDTVENSTKQVLIKLFSDHGARLVVWTGANGKLQLQKMKMIRVIYSSIKKLHPTATEHCVLSFIKTWIRRAGDRIRSKNKSKKNDDV